MDFFAPCNFANIEGYPNGLPNNGMERLHTFQGNNAVSVKAHLFAFAGSWNKFVVLNNNFEDVKMKLFILTFEQDAMEWFTEKPNNSFNTFESIIVSFKGKFSDKRVDKHLVRDINVIEQKENETVKKFNQRFKGIIK